MTSKERVRAAFAHKNTDRVPSTMQCVETAWDNLKKHFQVNTEEEIMDILEIDTRISQVMEYFEIFLTRMLLCRRAADALGLHFKLIINGQELL